ncbi:MAG: DUF4011 domain-containing protein [Clostridiales bacterium]|nr:DUF4011 domain-containing protein [Clostridiales bacterium]
MASPDISREDQKFDLWERKLLDLSTRNSLLNVKMKGTTVPLLVTSACDIEDSLSSEKDYAIISRVKAGEVKKEDPAPAPTEEETSPEQPQQNEQQEQATTQPEPEKTPAIPAKEYEIEDLEDNEAFRDVLAKGLASNNLYSSLPEKDLEDRLKKLYRNARTAVEEDGTGTLFLACGFLKWCDDKKDAYYYAPIVLVPVELVRKFGVGKFVMRKNDEDAVINITLLEKLRKDFDFITTELEGDAPQDASGVDVKGIFNTLKGIVEAKKDWQVTDACVLGMFSFSQFVMWNDLHSHRDLIAKNAIVKSLLEGQLQWQYEDMEKQAEGFTDESSVYLPLSADNSQLYAIYKASGGITHDGETPRECSSFVLHGPPGTGKSQTITSMIANALADGKKVLFAAEKKAALDVVYTRLNKIGIAPFCLELHSNKVRKGVVLDQLKEAAEVRLKGGSGEDYKKALADIEDRRHELDKYAGELNRRRPEGYTLYEMLNIYAENESAPDIILENGFAEGLTEDRVNASVAALGELIAAGRGMSGILPYVKATDYSQDTKVKLQPELEALLNSTNKLAAAVSSVKASCPAMSIGTDIASVENAVALIESFFGARRELLLTWDVGFLAQDPKALKASYDGAASKWGPMRSMALSKVYNNVKSLDKTGKAADELDKHIAALDSYKSTYGSKGFDVSGNIPAALPELMATYKEFDASRAAVNGRLGIAALNKGASGVTFDSIRSLVSDIRANEASIRAKTIFNRSASSCTALKLSSVVSAFEEGRVDENTIVPAFMKAWSKLLICSIIDGSEVLSTFSGKVYEEKIQQLKSLSDEFEKITRQQIFLEILRRRPDINIEANSASSLGKLQKAIKSRGRGISIRALFSDIEKLILELTPCVLMSPKSAAQFIALSDEPMFDLVIFDEASQLPTSEAVGVIARGRHAVIVGDPNQMPPTTFFREQVFDEDNYETEDLESILDDCLAVGMPQTKLLWHYRSRHESLITFSNRSFYESKLYTFPSADDVVSRATLVKCNGIFDSGRTRTNPVEAQAVVNELVSRSRDSKLSGYTYGVVTFNIQQQNLIEDLIDEVCRTDSEFEKWAYGGEEAIFIKNLENVQGDERDVILFSVGYGPDAEGKVSMNFGPLNKDGGWRRLNVAVTRSRIEMKVFASMEPEQIKLSDATSEGVKALKRFLMYTEGNALWDADVSAVSTGSAGASGTPVIDRSLKYRGLAEDICNRLNTAGYYATSNVGKSGFKVDIGVSSSPDAGSYCLGLLIDGAASGGDFSATAREISQPSMLNGLGWKTKRIWSIEWWEDPDRVIAECVEAIRETESSETSEKAEGTEAADVSSEEDTQKKTDLT